MPTMPTMPSRQLLSTLITSLTNTRWTLTRTLRSENPLDLNGELRGTATFTPQPPTTTADRDWLYCEEGEIPSNVGGPLPAGLRWTKKYIWRLGSDSGHVSVWFVKVASGPEEADYLFHDFDFDSGSSSPLGSESGSAQKDPGEFVAPPVPPAVSTPGNEMETTVLNARGNHLCINDMYRTAYAFRIEPDTGEVLSWASRHVVRGPKKGQDIVNRYEKEA
ncbi:hypothetical protein DTO013E5_8531 [Penicillium roqueforti]|uniref:Genomic scaffold, ProqFM164S01 n=1 Tax=Penicillium roqueforti (strain FM164) TaxID=1365484 RepID=W6QCU2_PENRF|nr:uncharacterized protein LCP9604111_4497 [Penicillium roqueforti]CDM27422.1 unnamed protein product [Penicillium roqueforti FM164]KAF9249341.1 hypothetical protein LCP9604111_4497 [Penicillium roqueforti]KAI1834147.1 hypothetical protein CBS147337_5111 [Penicillium roqueforti]KAI2674937.1 hypothetical protein CBS147355_6751 [Penicillium roqueforti]KAI2688195.1 hypothetical protein LCP963914a_2597 [Penicillium roqueforti]